MHAIRVGERLPPVRLGRLDQGQIESVRLEELLAGRRAIIVGLPGAFTPTCSQTHLPDFVANAPSLKASGFDLVICLSANDPWTLDAWARELDPLGRLMFLSDGNLELSRKLGLVRKEPAYFLGERCRRFVLIAENAVVTRLSIEPDAAQMTCTRAEDVLLEG